VQHHPDTGKQSTDMGNEVDGLQPYGSKGPGASVRPRPFTFVTTFKWEMRKGWDVLLAAYLQVRPQLFAMSSA
jgi:hypothetical protein